MWKSILAVAVTMTLAACGRAGLPDPLPDRADLVIRGINYVGLVVEDLDQATAFYAGPADLSTAYDVTLANSDLLDGLAERDGVEVQTRLLRSVNGQLRLMQFAAPSSTAQAATPQDIKGPGFSHICFQAAETTDIYQNFMDAGATALGVEGQYKLSLRNPVHYAYVRDLDGAIVEIEEVDIAALNLDEPPRHQYRMRHVAIATPDMDRITAFYSTLMQEPDPRKIGGANGFGGDKVEQLSGVPGAKLRMSWFPVRNLEFEIGQYVSHPSDDLATPRPVDALGYNMVVFDVSDLEAARRLLIEAGGTVVTETGLLDDAEIFFGRDPDGNLLGFQTAAANSDVSAQLFADNGA